MTAPIPAYDNARNDFALIGFPLTLYLHLLHDYLNVQDFVPVKSESLASRWQTNRVRVERNLRILVELGYIEKRKRGGQTTEYRLVYRKLP